MNFGASLCASEICVLEKLSCPHSTQEREITESKNQKALNMHQKVPVSELKFSTQQHDKVNATCEKKIIFAPGKTTSKVH